MRQKQQKARKEMKEDERLDMHFMNPTCLIFKVTMTPILQSSTWLDSGGGGDARVRSVSTPRNGSPTSGMVVYTVVTSGLGVCCRSL